MAWRCDRCGTIHTQNPRECRQCKNTTFEPVGAGELEDQSVGIDSPEPMDSADIETISGTIETKGDPSPDLNPDGSLKTQERPSTPPEESPSRKSAPAATYYYKLRALIIAPLKLLWSYIIPILAFLIVFGLIFWLLL